MLLQWAGHELPASLHSDATFTERGFSNALLAYGVHTSLPDPSAQTPIG